MVYRENIQGLIYQICKVVISVVSCYSKAMLMILKKCISIRIKALLLAKIRQTVMIVLMNYEESKKILNFLYQAWIRFLVL